MCALEQTTHDTSANQYIARDDHHKYKDWLVNLTLIEQLERYNFEIDYSLLIFVPVYSHSVLTFYLAT
jgi:hypothetical protein